MRIRRGEQWPLAVSATLLLSAPVVASSDDVEPVRIEFHAPSGCPGESAFLDQVRARTSKSRPAAAGERARTFTITVTQRGSRILGLLKIEDPPAPPAVREVSGEECSEIVSALALITALAVDPHASTAPAARLSTAPPPQPAAPSPGAPSPSSGEAARSEPPPPFPAPHPAPYIAPPTWLSPVATPLPALLTPPPNAVPPRWRLSLGLHAAAVDAVAPDLIPGLDGFIDVERAADSVFSPSFRASVFWVQGSGARLGPVFSNYYWVAGRLEGCPLALSPVAKFRLSPCALVDAGMLQVEGGGRVNTVSRSRPWVAPGILGRIRWEVVDPLVVEVEAGASFPLIRDTFYVAPGINVHSVPAVGASLAAGVGVHFF
jgi:hypothetical protein